MQPSPVMSVPPMGVENMRLRKVTRPRVMGLQRFGSFFRRVCAAQSFTGLYHSHNSILSAQGDVNAAIYADLSIQSYQVHLFCRGFV